MNTSLSNRKAMKNILDYIYYRIAKFYKNTFGIEDAPGCLLIHSCYSWGLLVLVTTLISYVLAIETVVLWEFGIKTNTVLIIITILPFGLFCIFAERFLGDLKTRYKLLDKKHKNDKFSFFKGLGVFVFVCSSFVCYCVALSHCR